MKIGAKERVGNKVVEGVVVVRVVDVEEDKVEGKEEDRDVEKAGEEVKVLEEVGVEVRDVGGKKRQIGTGDPIGVLQPLKIGKIVEKSKKVKFFPEEVSYEDSYCH